MKMQNQSKQKKQNLDNSFIQNGILGNYLDMIIRGLLGLIVIVIVLFFIRKMVNLGVVWSLVVAFILSLIISPIVSKIKLGHKVQEKYNAFLNNIIKKARKNKFQTKRLPNL